MFVFFNIPESKSLDTDESFKHDIDKLKLITDGKVKLESSDIKSIFRAGPKIESKTRPIIIRLTSFEKKIEILKLRGLTYETKDAAGKTVTTPIYTSPDRTKKQQDENKKLVAQLKEARDKDKDNKYTIDHKSKKVVLLEPFLQRSQSYWD